MRLLQPNMSFSAKTAGTSSQAETTQTRSSRITAPPATGGNLRSLTGIRAFAALAVFSYHVSSRWHVFHLPGASLGYTGVGLFFILSGFVLTWSARAPLRAWDFYRRRFARIYPAYLVMVFVAAIAPVVQVSRNIADAAANLLLAQSWDPRGHLTYTMNGVAWSLSDEAFFYAVLPVVLAYMLKHNRSARWFAAGGYWGFASLLVVLGHTHALTFFFPPIRLGEFMLGVAAACDLKEGRRYNLSMWTVIILMLGGLVVARFLPYPEPDVMLALPFVILLIVAANSDIRGSRSLLTRPWVVYGGEISYCFYLVHELIIVNLHHLMGQWPGWQEALIALTVAILAAAALHHSVERPCQRLLISRRPSMRSQLDADRPKGQQCDSRSDHRCQDLITFSSTPDPEP